jgi:hypothetical protein
MVFACIAITIALSSPVVRRIFRTLVEPRIPWLFASREEDSPSRRDPTGSHRRPEK